jgi:hypothetical protein
MRIFFDKERMRNRIAQAVHTPLDGKFVLQARQAPVARITSQDQGGTVVRSQPVRGLEPKTLDERFPSVRDGPRLFGITKVRPQQTFAQVTEDLLGRGMLGE